ncbi:MAG: SDR family oxidoreductase [Acidimicrobiales bacterium]
MAGRLSGKVALVTGSASGIGAATARALSAEGATVVVNSATSVEAGEALATELIDASYVRADIAKPEAAAALVEQAVDTHGRLDILVNNAGTTVKIPHNDFASVTPEVWGKILGVNVLGTWSVTAAAVPHLQAAADGARGAAAIVNVTSLAGLRPAGSSIPYAVSKAAVNHLTLLLANVLGPEIRVNAVAPGLVDTPWTAEWELERNYVRAMSPLKSSSTPEDVAEVIVGLVHARQVTGEVVAIDGGLHLR